MEEESDHTLAEESGQTLVEESGHTVVEESDQLLVKENAHALVEESDQTLVKENALVEESGQTLVEESGHTSVKESVHTLVEESDPALVEESDHTLVEMYWEKMSRILHMVPWILFFLVSVAGLFLHHCIAEVVAADILTVFHTQHCIEGWSCLSSVSSVWVNAMSWLSQV
jgi:hypothetical protein